MFFHLGYCHFGYENYFIFNTKRGMLFSFLPDGKGWGHRQVQCWVWLTVHDVGQLVQAQHRSKAPSEKVKRAEFLIIAIDIQWELDYWTHSYFEWLNIVPIMNSSDYEWHSKTEQPDHSKFSQMATILFFWSSIFKWFDHLKKQNHPKSEHWNIWILNGFQI